MPETINDRFDKKFGWGHASLVNSDKVHPRSIRDVKEIKYFIAEELDEIEKRIKAERSTNKRCSKHFEPCEGCAYLDGNDSGINTALAIIRERRGKI